jgi:disulfide bond formation protein DsbB
MTRRRADLAQGMLWTLAGAWALGWVWWAQHVAGMAPCELCFWERWPYRALILLGLAWLLLAGRGLGRVLGALVTVTLLAAIAVSVLHVGVEQGWWPSPLPACAAPHFSGGTFAERLAAMPLRPAKPCDAPNRLFAWLPVSMTTLDLIYAALLLLVGRLLLPRPIQPSRSSS